MYLTTPRLSEWREGVTIAIPNWNHELVLPRAVASALKATKALRMVGVPCEVLVVDDASRDGSITLLRQLEALLFEEDIRVLALIDNGGPAMARSMALCFARYRHILFLDADNELVSMNVPHFYRAIQETGAAMVYGNLIRLQGKETMTTLLSHESFQTRIFVENYIDNSGLYDRQQLLDCGGYDISEKGKGREDWELILHLSTNGRLIVFVPMVMGFYYDLQGSQNKHDLANVMNYAYIRRSYDQLSMREHLPLNTRHARYHPEIGYI